MNYEFNIPLFYRLHEAPGNGGFPEVHPFQLTMEGHSGFPCQKSTIELNEILRRIYSQGLMMTGSMDADDLVGSIHARDCLAFTLSAVPILRGKKVLEIGCGQGVILDEISRRGADCVGLEPGRQIQKINAKSIRLVNDFFPTPQLAGEKFDLITSFNVIEHVEDVALLLDSVNDSLATDGDFVFCVPNCGPYLAAGDISILLHEHFNYFSEKNVQNLLTTHDFSVERIEISGNSALLLVHAKKGRPDGNRFQLKDAEDADHFVKSLRAINDRVGASMNNFDDAEIAVYCPNRALNLLSQLERKKVRIIDDTPIALGKYYPYFDRPVENFAGLVERPPKAVYIFSYTHGELLRRRCRGESRLNNVAINVISDFY